MAGSRKGRGRHKHQSDAEYIGERYAEIYRVVRTIPRGRVVTYGQVAELAGMPGAARVVGAAMRASPEELGLPWQRVVGKKARGLAKVSILDPIGGAIQRQLLEDEGVEFSESGAISLAEFGGVPLDENSTPKKKTARPKRARRLR